MSSPHPLSIWLCVFFSLQLFFSPSYGQDETADEIKNAAPPELTFSVDSEKPLPLSDPDSKVRSELASRGSEEAGKTTDTHGFRWIFSGNGVLMRNDQGLREGFAPSLDGNSFQPESPFKIVKESANGGLSSMAIGSTANTIRLRRFIRVDEERAAVFFQDVFENPEDSEFTGKLTYKTVTDRDFTAALTSTGRPLSNGIRGDEVGVFFQQNPDGGKANLFILATDGSVDPPPLKFNLSSNSDIEMNYDLTIPPQGRIALLHCIGLQNSTLAANPKDVFAPFFKFRKLYRASTVPGFTKFLTNFTLEEPLIMEGQQELLALNTVCQRLEIERGNSDVLWLSEDSVLTGKFTAPPLSLETSFGTVDLEIDQLAGLGGGAARGLPARAYMRDGSVLIGELSGDPMRLKGDEGWEVDVPPTTLQHLFTGIAASDGTPPPKTTHLLTLRSGSVIPVLIPKKSRISLNTPWGLFESAASQLRSIELDEESGLQLYIETVSGTRLQAFPSGGNLSAKSPLLGALKIPLTDLAALTPLTKPPSEETELSGGVELQGGNFIAGKFLTPTINFITKTATTELNSQEIVHLTRGDEDSPGAPSFECEIAGDEILIGTLATDHLQIEDPQGKQWTLPLSQVVEYTKTEGTP